MAASKLNNFDFVCDEGTVVRIVLACDQALIILVLFRPREDLKQFRERFIRVWH